MNTLMSLDADDLLAMIATGNSTDDVVQYRSGTGTDLFMYVKPGELRQIADHFTALLQQWESTSCSNGSVQAADVVDGAA